MTDDRGRFVEMEVNLHGITISILGIYAPNEDKVLFILIKDL